MMTIDITLTGEQIDHVVREDLKRCVKSIEDDLRRGWEFEELGNMYLEALNIVLGMYGER